MLLPGRREDQHDDESDGSLPKIDLDMEAMGDEELGPQKDPSILPELFSCALQVS